MPNRFVKTNSKKILFLICPTDSMEKSILTHFSGVGYFYTALGVYFEYDFTMQSELWELICEHRIEEVVFVTAFNNVFFVDVSNKNVKHSYPVDEALAEAKSRISKHLIQPEVFSSNYHLLVANHLKHQKRRLLSTNYLGSRLKKEKIMVNAYAYHPEKINFPATVKSKRWDICLTVFLVIENF